LNFPSSLVLDAIGNLYIADTANNVIRRVDASTGIITTVAGNGTSGYDGDSRLAVDAELQLPTGVALDEAGNFYIADSGNNVIRRVDAVSGAITTAAGHGVAGYNGDGGLASDAGLNQPVDVLLNRAGDLYIVDSGNNVVRKVEAASGIISTVAGSGTSGFSGDGGAATNAELNSPGAIAWSPLGDLYIADTGNEVIREVDAVTGKIATMAGTAGVGAFSGDGGPASSATLNNPFGIHQ
jgi:sugar lactone lactonase YvrE